MFVPTRFRQDARAGAELLYRAATGDSRPRQAVAVVATLFALVTGVVAVLGGLLFLVWYLGVGGSLVALGRLFGEDETVES